MIHLHDEPCGNTLFFAGDATCLFALAGMYESGSGKVQLDKSKALDFYKRAVDKGDQRAGVHAATLLKQQIDAAGVVPPLGSYDEIHFLASKSANAGFGPGMSYFGLLLAAGWQGDGGDVMQQHQQAANWFSQAAFRDDVIAMTNLGVLSREGMGKPVSLADSKMWFMRAANKAREDLKGGLGDSRGQWAAWELGTMFEKESANRTVDEAMNEDESSRQVSLREALDWYRVAASHGNEKAQIAVDRLTAASRNKTRSSVLAEHDEL